MVSPFSYMCSHTFIYFRPLGFHRRSILLCKRYPFISVFFFFFCARVRLLEWFYFILYTDQPRSAAVFVLPHIQYIPCSLRNWNVPPGGIKYTFLQTKFSQYIIVRIYGIVFLYHKRISDTSAWYATSRKKFLNIPFESGYKRLIGYTKMKFFR
jgi:hypothetical protein